MTLEIRNHSDGYLVIESETGKLHKAFQSLDEANQECWINKTPQLRYQILANSWANRHELTWCSYIDDLIVPNGYETFEEARLAIVEDLIELCLNNDYLEHPNPFGDYSIIDTFTGEELSYDLLPEEYCHPNPEEIENND